MNGYFKGNSVNSPLDYLDKFDPYNPNIEVPIEWKAPPPVRVRYRRVPGSELSGMEGIGDTIFPIYLQAKQLVLDHWLFLLAGGVGLFLVWRKDQKEHARDKYARDKRYKEYALRRRRLPS